MKATKLDLLNLQRKRTDESFAMAKMAMDAGFWNSAASELYYTFFYCVRMLFSLPDIDAQTHKGVKILFAEKFIKEGSLEANGVMCLPNSLNTGNKVITESSL